MSRSRSKSRSRSRFWSRFWSRSSGYGVGLGENMEYAERCGELGFDASAREFERLGKEVGKVVGAAMGDVYELLLVLVELLGLTGG